MRFEWDDAKARHNRQKHGVAFNEASTVFGDPLHYGVPDPDHSQAEDRWVTIGHSDHGRLLIVSHTYRPHADEAAVRLISARKLTSEERADYERRLQEYLRGQDSGASE